MQKCLSSNGGVLCGLSICEVGPGGHGRGSGAGKQDVAEEAARARDVQAGDDKAKLATAGSKESTEKVVLRGTWRRGKGHELWQDKF